MKPQYLQTKIFLDSGNPEDTKKALDILGFLDGQTTNPSLVAKSPEAQECIVRDGHCTREYVLELYKDIVTEISGLVPDGSVSVEVNADKDTSASDMLAQGKEMYTWIPNAHVKFPTIPAGIEAAAQAVEECIRVNMTLVFTQEQAAAVYSATKGCNEGDIYLSPFIGRLDDKGQNGMDLIKNIIKMYSEAKSPHVKVLTASVRSLDHFMAAIQAGSDIITASLKTLEEWAEKGMPIPDESFVYAPEGLDAIPYKQLDLEKSWKDLDVSHQLVDEGIEKFVKDWLALQGK